MGESERERERVCLCVREIEKQKPPPCNRIKQRMSITSDKKMDFGPGRDAEKKPELFRFGYRLLIGGSNPRRFQLCPIGALGALSMDKYLPSKHG